jgi:nitrite reductase/ring-hydroxylating ferredoxin subunit/uncharacterized membrane protein
MSLKHLLQGRPLGHPLHPMLVHLPVGLFTLSLVLDLISLIKYDGTPFVRAAFYTMALGELAALLAAVPGLADYTDIRADRPARRTATWHMVLNITVVVIYALDLWLRRGALDQPHVRPLPLVSSILAFCIVGVSGYLGGRLIYDEGISVGRHRRRHGPTPRTLLRVSSGDAGTQVAPDGYVAVADATLEDGQSLCVDLNGTMMAVACVGGEYYAFQEFCAHRFGPLSEGRFTGHEVMCPWHRSCFDMRTGKVTHGPAKVDIKAFEVRVQNGKVWVGKEKPSAAS